MLELSISDREDTIKKASWEKPIIHFPADAAVDPLRQKILEIGPGRGDFLWTLSATHPHAQVIGIEIKRRRFFKLAKNARAKALPNILLFCGNAKHVMPQFFLPESLDEIHIQFPDPWPKRRHRKHRLLNPDTWEQLRSYLKPGACFHFVTDVEDYAKEVALVLGNSAIEQKLSPEFPSYFAEKWRKMGRLFYYQAYRKIP